MFYGLFIFVLSKTGIVKADTKTCRNCGSTNILCVAENNNATCQRGGNKEYVCRACGKYSIEQGAGSTVDCVAEDEPRYVYDDETNHKKAFCCKWCEEVIPGQAEELEPHFDEGEDENGYPTGDNVTYTFNQKTIVNNVNNIENLEELGTHERIVHCKACMENVGYPTETGIKAIEEPHNFGDLSNVQCGATTDLQCVDCKYKIPKVKMPHIEKTIYEYAGVIGGEDTHKIIIGCENCNLKKEGGTEPCLKHFIFLNDNCCVTKEDNGYRMVEKSSELDDNSKEFYVGYRYYCTLCQQTVVHIMTLDGKNREWDRDNKNVKGDEYSIEDNEKVIKDKNNQTGPGGDNPGGQTPNGTLPGYTPSSPIITPEQECEHDDTKVKHDDDLHWKECTKCNNIIQNSEDPHTFGEVTDDGGTTGTHSAVCTFEGCGYKQTQAHEFDDSGNCTECDAIQNTGCQHDYSIVSNDDTHHWTGCSKCGEIQEESKKEHNLGKYENNQDGTHIAKCTFTGCEYKSALMHTFDENGKCEECDAESCDEGEHEFSIFKWNDTQHWLACKWCEGAKKDSIENHKFEQWTMNANGKQQSECTNKDCGYIAEKDAENPGGNDADGILGDVNLNGEIDITDITTLNEHVLAELSESMPEWILKDKALTLADLNKDGNVDISDITELNTIVLNSIINGN